MKSQQVKSSITTLSSYTWLDILFSPTSKDIRYKKTPRINESILFPTFDNQKNAYGHSISLINLKNRPLPNFFSIGVCHSLWNRFGLLADRLGKFKHCVVFNSTWKSYQSQRCNCCPTSLHRGTASSPRYHNHSFYSLLWNQFEFFWVLVSVPVNLVDLGSSFRNTSVRSVALTLLNTIEYVHHKVSQLDSNTAKIGTASFLVSGTL